MKWLCFLRHDWSKVQVLEQTLSSGLKMTLDGDVCKRCGILDDAWNARHVYCMMLSNHAPIIAHPAVFGGAERGG